MKYSVFFAFMLVAGMLYGQITITSPYLTYTVEPTDFEVVAKCTVKNESNMGQQVTWVREVDCITNGWNSMVCDATACWAPSVNSKTFVLAAGDTSFLDVHVQPLDVVGGAVIKMKVFFTNDAGVEDDVELKFNVCTNSSVDLGDVAVTLFPNPVLSVFGLTAQPASVKGLRVVDAQGRQVANFAADASQKYDISHLPAGQYYVFLLDGAHRILGVLPLFK
jgi:hypothetical protein